MSDQLGEVTATSVKGFDDAVRRAVERAQRTMDHVNGARVLEQEVVVRRGRIAEYRVVVSITVDALVSVTEDQRIVDFNPGAEAIFGYASEEALGGALEMLIPERYRAEHAGNVGSFARSGARERMMGERERIVGRRKDGSEFPAEASIARHVVEGEPRFTVLLRELSEH